MRFSHLLLLEMCCCILGGNHAIRTEQNISLFQINISGHSQVAYEKKMHTEYNSRVTDIISLLCGYLGDDGLIA